MSATEDAFYRYYANESLAASTLERFEATKYAVERAAEFFGLALGPWQVGDIGCGAATQCGIWARDGHNVVGVDINEGLLKLGRERAAAAGLKMELSVGSATSLPWPDASLDICLSPELLEHVADWESCLREADRVLKPGGVLYLSTTNKLCPIQEEFTLPLYSWYPAPLKRRYEKLAVTTRPEIANHAKYPAVNWFSYFELRRYLGARGFRCMDRFDVAALKSGSAAQRMLLGLVRAATPLRWLGHVMTPYTMVFAQKTKN
jgi:ubiquinone/menaquinone biosynthesis C-methylase UbiE